MQPETTLTAAAPNAATQYLWPIAQLGDALAMMARQLGTTKSHPIDPPSNKSANSLSQWIELAASHAGIEAVGIDAPYPDVETLLHNCGPAIVALPTPTPTSPKDISPSAVIEENDLIHFVVIARRHRKRLQLLCPDGSTHILPVATLRSLIFAVPEQLTADELTPILSSLSLSAKQRTRVLDTVLQQRLTYLRLRHCWMLRLPQHSPLVQQLRHAGLLRRLALLLLSHTGQYLLMLAGWGAIGRGCLQGHLDAGWLIAGGLLLLCAAAGHCCATWLQGRVAIEGGALVKRRLLAGALQFDPDELRKMGGSQLLSRTLESNIMESLALSGGFAALLAVIELIVVAVLLTISATGWLHSFLLLLWCIGTGALAWRYAKARARWTNVRMELTNYLIETMLGHRTRIAQQPPERWHDGEDEALTGYLHNSAQFDLKLTALNTWAAHAWLVASAALIGLVSVSNSPSVVLLSISIGATILGYQAFSRLIQGVTQLCGAGIAWRQVADLFHAAGIAPELGSLLVTVPGGTARLNDLSTETSASASPLRPPAPPQSGQAKPDPHCPPVASVLGERSRLHSDGVEPAQTHNTAPKPTSARILVEGHRIHYRYNERAEPALNQLGFTISEGDHILLQGPSGGGKSTLGSILAGLRKPSSGQLFIRGLDRPSLGEHGWRRHIVAVPQFHENHVITETFAFNLLMGRTWPPTAQDLQEAETICHELGLQDLLRRMPAGIMQMVGETGWQLSHGERSRLFLARALLQRADLIIFDESFGALDPENQLRALQTVLSRTQTVLVIAHP